MFFVASVPISALVILYRPNSWIVGQPEVKVRIGCAEITSGFPVIGARVGCSWVAQAMVPSTQAGNQGQFSMTEDGRSAVRRLFLLESVYKGGRRLAMVLAKHPFEPVLQIRLV